MYRDPELPNGFQDSDFDQRELERLGNLSSKLRKQGKCTHGWRQCSSAHNDIPKGYAKCLDCGKLAPETELDAEMRELLC